MNDRLLVTEGLETVLETEEGLARAVDALSLAIDRRETFALVGESGCGKSMTALSLLRLLPDNGRIAAGSIRLLGQDLCALRELDMQRVRGARISMIFQEPSTSLNPVMTIGQQVLEVIERHTKLRGAQARARVIEWLDRVGLPEAQRRFDTYPFQMSGGQKQRVMIALALAAEPDLLIADEPTTALDVSIQGQILDLLKQLQRDQGMGLLLITHDLAVVHGMAHRVALMYAGQIVEVAETTAFFAQPRHPYAQLLLRALPGAGSRGEPLAAIAGTVPPLTSRFAGCRFVDRCDRAMPACGHEAPALVEHDPDHSVRCLLYGAAMGGTGLARAASDLLAAQPRLGRVSVQSPLTVGQVSRSVSGPIADTKDAAVEVPLLSAEHLTVRFALRKGLLLRTASAFEAVSDVSFQIFPGRTLALVGESGCGKTTIGKAMLQLLRGVAQVHGRVLFEGKDLFSLHGEALRAARRDIQIVFQDPFASLNPRLRVMAVLEEGLITLMPHLSAAERASRIEALIERVGLRRDALNRYPHEFSGGQRQRIAIARALAVSPKLIVCDEPTSALDVSVQAQILNLLRELQQEMGVSYVFITHNIGVVEHIADDVAVMRAGRFVEEGPTLQVFASPREAYTRMLLAAVPRIDGPVRVSAPAP